MNYAVILSGGVGSRLGLDVPKQYYEVNGQPIIRYVIDTIEKCDFIDGFVIVAESRWQEYIKEQISVLKKFLGFAFPGENRQLSIYNGLEFLKHICTVNENDIVLIQDAARPNTSVDLICRCFSLAENEDGAMPVLPMKDTIYFSKSGQQVDGLLNRNELFAGQSPESFRFKKYLKANEALLPEQIYRINGSTEPAILAGMNIKMIAGEESNYKITTESDLQRFCEKVKNT